MYTFKFSIAFKLRYRTVIGVLKWCTLIIPVRIEIIFWVSHKTLESSGTLYLGDNLNNKTNDNKQHL
jgi:hypothetical protein